MIDTTIVELINKEVDGVILPEEADLLRKRLADDPSAKQLYNELHSVTKILAAVKEVDSPAGLRMNIMRAIGHHGAGRRSTSSVISSFLIEVRRVLTTKSAYVFSGGLVTGAVLVALFFTLRNAPTLDSSQVEGTLMLVGEKVDVSLDKVHGTISTERADGVQCIDLRLVSQDEVAARISFDADAVRVEGLKRLENRVTSLNIRGGEIDLQGSGKFGYRFSFSATGLPSPEVRVSLFSGGQMVYQKKIAFSRSN